MSANPERGEVEMFVGDRTYVLRPTMNALRALQKRTGLTYQQAIESLSTIDPSVMCELIFALLQPCHSKEIKTVDQAGDLIDEAGGFNAVLLLMSEMMRLNQPRGKGVLGEAKANPQTAQDGTGDNSGSTSAMPA
jgi:hypothetical protein